MPLFQTQIETQFDKIALQTIDIWFKEHGTRKQFMFLSNVTLDISCEKDSINLNENEVLSVLHNGTFFEPSNNIATKFTPDPIDVGTPT